MDGEEFEVGYKYSSMSESVEKSSCIGCYLPEKLAEEVFGKKKCCVFRIEKIRLDKELVVTRFWTYNENITPIELLNTVKVLTEKVVEPAVWKFYAFCEREWLV